MRAIRALVKQNPAEIEPDPIEIQPDPETKPKPETYRAEIQEILKEQASESQGPGFGTIASPSASPRRALQHLAYRPCMGPGRRIPSPREALVGDPRVKEQCHKTRTFQKDPQDFLGTRKFTGHQGGI